MTPPERSNKKFGNNINSDPELVFKPKRDYVDVEYDNFNMLKDEKANKEGAETKRKRRPKKKKRRQQKKTRRKKYRKKHYPSSNLLEYGDEYGDIDYQEDYGGTMKFIPRSKLNKRKNKKNKMKKKRRRLWKKNKEKRRKWKAVHLNL